MGATGPIDLVIFDCDGVLVDSERLSIEVDRRVLADLGWELSSDEIVHRFVGRSAAYFRSEIESYLGSPLPDDWEATYQPWYVAAFAELIAVDGVERALDEIVTATCVASSGTHAKIRRTLGMTGLLPRFQGRIFSVDDVVVGKPAPDLFLHAADRLGVHPEHCAVVEDSRFGVRAARAAGMRVYGYAGGLTPAEWLEQEGAVVFADMRDLPDLLGR
ncbi:6-phosphogluconate phosphatase [Microbacterium sp. Bi98]|uniref:HAD family hydrolase n=1 Tax=unclassified Microbacterium TaxID=2609290 RepID=UPI0006FC6419|nr:MULTISPECIES: HAD family hydrolase [unclassified Microbacterium]KRD51925.1 haloacid dehalogenase [Microbacterium sp. Root280D1]CAH0154783.1 6-phosphogluconate phosphatase [Microbacterium sp. Bi98]